MANKRLDRHPDHVRTVASKTPSAKQSPAPQALPSSEPLLIDPASLVPLWDALAGFLSRDDGWLRMVPQDHGRVAFWKWKFSRGKHAGSYVMARTDYTDHRRALEILARKVEDVDLGLSRPTPDSYFDS